MVGAGASHGLAVHQFNAKIGMRAVKLHALPGKYRRTSKERLAGRIKPIRKKPAENAPFIFPA